MTARRPTLDEIRCWPPAVPVPQGGSAYGLAKATAYEAIRIGTFPARVITVGGRMQVLTASILATLDPQEAAPHAR